MLVMSKPEGFLSPQIPKKQMKTNNSKQHKTDHHYPQKNPIPNNPIQNTHQPSKKEVCLMPVLSEELISTVGLHPTSCQDAIYHVGPLISQGTRYSLHL